MTELEINEEKSIQKKQVAKQHTVRLGITEIKSLQRQMRSYCCWLGDVRSTTVTFAPWPSTSVNGELPLSFFQSMKHKGGNNCCAENAFCYYLFFRAPQFSSCNMLPVGPTDLRWKMFQSDGGTTYFQQPALETVIRKATL